MERETDWRNELLTASACCSFACLAAASLAVAGIGLVAASAVAGIGLHWLLLVLALHWLLLTHKYQIAPGWMATGEQRTWYCMVCFPTTRLRLYYVTLQSTLEFSATVMTVLLWRGLHRPFL